jgi:hypothetical protein
MTISNATMKERTIALLTVKLLILLLSELSCVVIESPEVDGYFQKCDTTSARHPQERAGLKKNTPLSWGILYVARAMTQLTGATAFSSFASGFHFAVYTGRFPMRDSMHPT